MNKIFSILLFGLLLGGCRSGTSHQATPRKKTATNVRAERYMRTSIDSELAREKRGERPSASKATWRAYWDWRISLWRKEKRNGYEQYFRQHRKELGLKKISDL